MELVILLVLPEAQCSRGLPIAVYQLSRQHFQQHGLKVAGFAPKRAGFIRVLKWEIACLENMEIHFDREKHRKTNKNHTQTIRWREREIHKQIRTLQKRIVYLQYCKSHI